MNNGDFTSALPAADYHGLPAINISRLKNIDKSGKHFQYFSEHPVTTKPMTLGTAAHCAVLEPERFRQLYVSWDRRSEETGNLCPRRGKYWNEFQAMHAGNFIITEDEYANALAMQQAIRADATAMKYLQSGEPEVTMTWVTTLERPEGTRSVECRGRPDWVTTMLGRVPHLIGLKTARDVRPLIFGNAAARLGYPMSWAFYSDGYEAITGIRPVSKEIVVESSPPYDVVVYDIDEDTITQGREEYLRLLRIYCDCVERNEWLGIGGGREQSLAMPSWFFGNQVDDIGELELEP